MTDVIHAADEGIPPLAAVLVTDRFAKVRTGLSFVTRRIVVDVHIVPPTTANAFVLCGLNCWALSRLGPIHVLPSCSSQHSYVDMLT